jgi:Transposase DDE domain group 1
MTAHSHEATSSEITEERLASNLANFLRTSALPDRVEHWSLTTLREKLVKIRARIVRHGGYVVFQPAEVAVPRALFAEILRRDRTLAADARRRSRHEDRERLNDDDNLTGEVHPCSTEDRSKAPQTALTSRMGISGLSVNCFIPRDRQPPISLRCIEPSHIGKGRSDD